VFESVLDSSGKQISIFLRAIIFLLSGRRNSNQPRLEPIINSAGKGMKVTIRQIPKATHNNQYLGRNKLSEKEVALDLYRDNTLTFNQAVNRHNKIDI
jgi:hypothetical protein